MRKFTNIFFFLLLSGSIFVNSEASASPNSFELAILDMAETWPDKFPDKDVLLLKARLLTGDQLEQFKRAVLLRNPLLDFDQILFVRRKSGKFMGLPQNWNSNSSLPKTGYSNDLAVISIKAPENIRSIYRPENSAFIGDVDLHFNADKVLFSSIGSNGAWQVMEIGVDGKDLREVTRTEDSQINNYDPCYLPDGRIIFTSTAPYIGVPCINGSAPVANAFRCNNDGSEMEQLTFDQEHAWCPQVMEDGRILYLRWEYADLPHSNSRIMMTMNPDGSNQRSYYGSNSYWPNGIFFSRQIPGRPSLFIGIVTGHHGVSREGELILFDTAKGYKEADGVIQRIPGYGKPVKPIVLDRLADGSHPRFLHPYPLSEQGSAQSAGKYFIVSSNLEGNWGIYLVDVFDNMTLIKAEKGYALLEPIPLRKTPLPRIMPDKIIEDSKDATIFISDIYEGPGLKDIPRGEVKSLRLFTYTYGYKGMGGLYGVIGIDGPWDMRRILGSVPVEVDGSSVFMVPANTPISIQPLDNEGKALQLMRSWFVARPGENLSCIGCHETPGTAPTVRMTSASRKGPAEINPWYGPTRNFEFEREVQPVLDKYCLSCHASTKPEEDKLTITHQGKEIPYLGGNITIKKWTTMMPGHGSHGTKLGLSYFNLFRHTRQSGIESDMHLLTPMEFFADTCELIMMLEKGHHGVHLDAEAMDRLTTWIDLNRPFFGRWSQLTGDNGYAAENKRASMRKLYAGIDENHETLPETSPEPIKPVPPAPSGTKLEPLIMTPHVAVIPDRANNIIPITDDISMELVYVPAGSFAIGSASGYPDEAPMTKINVTNGFWMSKFEVSNIQYAKFDMGHDSRHEDRHGYQFGITGYPVNSPNQPVVRVNWNEAMSFCKWLSAKTGKKVCLPTEAQWEWACRAGTTTAMNYGDVDSNFSKHGNMADITLHNFSANPSYPRQLQNWERVAFNNPENIFDNWIPQIQKVNDDGFLSVAGGKYEPNAWGLCDMHGNVAEWTASLYKPYPYDDSDGRNDPSSPGRRVARGGSWYDRPKLCTSSFRRAYRPYQKVYNVGFRVIIEE